MSAPRVAKFATPEIAATDAPLKRGGTPVSARPKIQDLTMLKVAEKPAEGKAKTVPAKKFHTVSDTHRAAIWLDDMGAKPGVHTVVADLTPEIAAVLLERNPANRKIKFGKVQDYAKDMKQGAWKFNGEPVIVASDGLLNDGQHRCAAVLESRTPVKVVFVFGVTRDTRDTLDQGANRTSADYLSIHGHSDTNQMSGAAKSLWQWRTYGMVSDSSKYRPTRSEIVETVTDNPGLSKSLSFVTRRGGTGLYNQRSTLAFCHFAFSSVTSDRLGVDAFFESLISGANLKPGDPILYARNRLIADRKSLRAPEKTELLFRAWNAHRLGQTRVLFRVVGGELPILEA